MEAAYVRRIAEGTEAAAEQNTSLLASDFTLTRGDSKVKITLALATSVKIRIVDETAELGFYLNGGTAIPADAAYTEELLLYSGGAWNIQTDDVAGVTFNMYVVQEESRT